MTAVAMGHELLPALYLRHIARHCRRPETAISLKAAQAVWSLLDERTPRAILELGSGFSSTVIRTWQQAHPETVVYTTDTDWKWLGATLYELELEQLDTRHVLHHDIFARLPIEQVHQRFDVVFLDLADTDTRARWVPRVLDWLRPDGLLILDDWQMAHYRSRVEPVLQERGFTITTLPDTTDDYGRYLATGVTH